MTFNLELKVASGFFTRTWISIASTLPVADCSGMTVCQLAKESLFIGRAFKTC